MLTTCKVKTDFENTSLQNSFIFSFRLWDFHKV
jgi:hypothetical protein